MHRIAVLVLAVAALAGLAAPPAQAGSASGTIAAGTLGVNITLSEMQSGSCHANPSTQGVDGWALDVGSASTITVRGSTPTNEWDINVLFLDSRCLAFATSATGRDEISRPIPSGTKLVLVQLVYGANVGFTANW